MPVRRIDMNRTSVIHKIPTKAARKIFHKSLRLAKRHKPLYKLNRQDTKLCTSETSVALGFGFRCGFLGMLHMEIVQERLEREFGMTVITTVPSVQFRAVKSDGSYDEVNSPAEMPDPISVSYIEEPFIRAQIITKSEYIGGIMSLCIDKRGTIKNQVYLTSDRVELTFEMPLSEIVFDFYDKLKTISRQLKYVDNDID